MSAAEGLDGTSGSATASGPVRASFSHVGISVGGLDAAQAWYEQVLGFTTRTPPAEAVTGTPQGATMSTPDGVHVEVFEPGEPDVSRPEAPLESWRAGPWQIRMASTRPGWRSSSAATTWTRFSPPWAADAGPAPSARRPLGGRAAGPPREIS